jgi:hypothetical protein
MRSVAISLSFLMLSSVAAGTAMADKPASQASSAQSSSASTAKTTTPSSQPAKDQELTAAEKDLLAQGYKMRMNDGQKVFCHRELVLGSNIEKTVCTTAERQAEARANGQALTQQIQRNETNPTGH